jgi:hypothetical protein
MKLLLANSYYSKVGCAMITLNLLFIKKQIFFSKKQMKNDVFCPVLRLKRTFLSYKMHLKTAFSSSFWAFFIGFLYQVYQLFMVRYG